MTARATGLSLWETETNHYAEALNHTRTTSRPRHLDTPEDGATAVVEKVRLPPSQGAPKTPSARYAQSACPFGMEASIGQSKVYRARLAPPKRPGNPVALALTALYRSGWYGIPSSVGC